jgi:hypothetical protein
VSERPDAQQARPDLSRHGAVPGPECAFVDDLAAPFVLSALEPGEQRRVDYHRARCFDCDKLIAELQAPVDLLGITVRQFEPPTRAKMALFDQIAKTSQHEARFLQPVRAADAPVAVPTLTIPSSRDAFAPDPGSWRTAGPGATSSSPSGRTGRFRPNWQSFATPLATVPLVLALGIVGVWAMNTQNRLSARSAEVQTLSAQVSSLSNRVNELNSTLGDVDEFMQAADSKVYDMSASNGEGDSDAIGMVIANPGTDDAMLVVKGLSSRHSMYEVVLESEDGLYTSAGEFSVMENGNGRAVLKLDQPFATYRAVHVKPMSDDSNGGSTDSTTFSAPDALTGAIDPNLGSDGDTDVPDVGQSG